MKGLLIRVGIDSTFGHWNAPVDPKTGRFVYVPIPESKNNLQMGYERPYSEIESALQTFGIGLPDHLHGQLMHLDPDFAELTYGDSGQRKAPIKNLTRGDFIVFYAGLKPISPFENPLMYALIGFYILDEVVQASSIPKARWKENAHTRRLITGTDIVVRAQSGYSGRLSRCIPVGVFRDRAYRVKKNLVDNWGGLSVKNGYIQRSGRIPSFLDPETFCQWFRNQKIELVRRNN